MAGNPEGYPQSHATKNAETHEVGAINLYRQGLPDDHAKKESRKPSALCEIQPPRRIYVILGETGGLNPGSGRTGAHVLSSQSQSAPILLAGWEQSAATNIGSHQPS